MDTFIDDIEKIGGDIFSSPGKAIGFILVILLIFLSYILSTNELLKSAVMGNVTAFWFKIKDVVDILLTIATLVSIMGLIHYVIKLRDLNSFEYHKYKPIEVRKDKQDKKFAEWEIVQNHIESGRPAEWKLAILEADNMLEELVRKVGYEGETLGERLKSIDPSDFSSIEGAWDAHKVRNRIAHEGASYVLTEREARRVIRLYEQVFKEFQYI